MKFKQDELYKIVWRDHFSTDGFFEKSNVEIDKDMVLTSVGFFIAEDDNYIHLARTKGETLYADTMSIVKVLILDDEHIILTEEDPF